MRTYENCEDTFHRILQRYASIPGSRSPKGDHQLHWRHQKDRFDYIVSFRGNLSLSVKPDVTPSTDAPRKCSIHIKAKLKQELDCMEENGIIKKIEHHTDWCSSIATSVKQEGSLRVCFDPNRLNDCLMRSPPKIPTLEELNP